MIRSQLVISGCVFIAGLVVSLAAGCGGIAVVDGEGQGGAGGTGNASSASNASASSGGPSALQVTLIEAFGSANCQPVVDEDPLRVMFTLNLDNSGGGQNAAVSFNSVQVASVEGVTSFKTNPADVIISAGVNQDVEVDKVDGSASGTNGCNYCGATDLTLLLELSIDGQPLNVEGPVNSMSCSF